MLKFQGPNNRSNEKYREQIKFFCANIKKGSLLFALLLKLGPYSFNFYF